MKKKKMLLIVIISVIVLTVGFFYYTRTKTIGEVINITKLNRYLKNAEKVQEERPELHVSLVSIRKPHGAYFIEEYNDIYELVNYISKQKIHKEIGFMEKRAENDYFQNNDEDYYSINIDVMDNIDAPNKKKDIKFEIKIYGDKYINISFPHKNNSYFNYYRLEKPIDLNILTRLIEKYPHKD